MLLTLLHPYMTSLSIFVVYTCKLDLSTTFPEVSAYGFGYVIDEFKLGQKHGALAS